jgi:hypothetical protein
MSLEEQQLVAAVGMPEIKIAGAGFGPVGESKADFSIAYQLSWLRPS